MNARKQYRTEAIVLRLLDYGESDRIVTFCTAGYGKIRGIAKGARRSRKRFANALEPFCFSQLLFTRRGPDSLAMIDSSEVISHFPLIRADLEKTLRASYLIDLTDQFLPEEKKNEAVFELLNAFLRLLEEHPATESLLRFFEIRLLKLAGYDPVLDRCLLCRTPVGTETSYRFVAADGGLIVPLLPSRRRRCDPPLARNDPHAASWGATCPSTGWGGSSCRGSPPTRAGSSWPTSSGTSSDGSSNRSTS